MRKFVISLTYRNLLRINKKATLKEWPLGNNVIRISLL